MDATALKPTNQHQSWVSLTAEESSACLWRDPGIFMLRHSSELQQSVTGALIADFVWGPFHLLADLFTLYQGKKEEHNAAVDA